MPGAILKLHNAVTSYEQSVVSDEAGSCRFNNVPLNSYQLTTTAAGFSNATQTINVSDIVPLAADVTLTMAEVSTSVNVVENAGAVVVNEPGAHTDADTLISKLPSFEPGAGLSSVINNSTGGTSSDANGFFHPLGDHAQVSFVIDGRDAFHLKQKTWNGILNQQSVTYVPGLICYLSASLNTFQAALTFSHPSTDKSCALP